MKLHIIQLSHILKLKKNIDYTSFNVETSQKFDSNIYPSNEPNIGAETIFDENIYQTTEPYIETNEQYDQPSTTSFDTNDFLAKETYTDTTSTIIDTSSQQYNNEDITKGYEGFDNTFYQTNEPYIETSYTVDANTHGAENQYGETDESYNVVDHYLETDPVTEIIKTNDETPFPKREPYFEIDTTVDNSYQVSDKKTGEIFKDTTDYQAFIETPKNDYLSTEQYFETEGNNINYKINDPYPESSINNENKSYQISEHYDEITTTFDDTEYRFIEPYIKTNLQENITLTFDFNTNIEPRIDTTSSLKTTTYTTNTQNFDIFPTLEKEKAPNTTSSESTKPIFDLPIFEANEYQQNEIYDIVDNLGSESKTSSPNIESIPNISQKKTDKELTLQTLDNKSNGISSTYNINEPITNNFDYNEYKTSKPIIETTYREFKPSLETTSTIETKSVTSSTPTFEKYNPSFDLDTVGIETPTSDNLSLKTKEPITTITTFETNQEFDYTSNVGGDFDVTTEIKPMAAAPDVTSKNINPKYTSKTYQAKNPVIKTGFDFTNLGISSYYDMGEKYNEYKTTTLKKSKQNITLPTDYTTIKTVSKPVNASTTTTTLLQSTPSFVEMKYIKIIKLFKI